MTRALAGRWGAALGALATLAALVGDVGCVQQLDTAAAQGPSSSPGGAVDATGTGGHTVAQETPPIELDEQGNTTADPCEATRQQSREIMSTYCASCHGGGSAGAHQGQPPFDFVLDVARLRAAVSATAVDPATMKAAHFLTPGLPAQSRVYVRVAGGEMPPRDVVGLPSRPRPTISDVSVLEAWIARCMGGP